MEFIVKDFDKKNIQKQDIGINQFFIENSLKQIESIIEFLNSEESILLVKGFMGTGKILAVNQALSFVNENVITLKYNCFETTILDDILLEFFETFKNLTVQNVIQIPKAKTENFTQKINAYFNSIQKPIIIVLNSFEQILKTNKQEILDFLSFVSDLDKVKIILVGRKFGNNDFKIPPQKIAIRAFEKGIFEKYLRSEDIKQIGPLSDELYKYTRGYYFYTTLAIKIMQIRKLNLPDFLSGYTSSFLSFNDFILREALSLVDPISGHLIRFLTIMRHPVNVKLLKTLNLYNGDRLAYFVDNLVLTRESSLIYLQDYYKEISENSIADNISIKIHKSCIDLYNTQLPLKPLERDLLISRQTMRKEIEYHELFIPKKPSFTKLAIEKTNMVVPNIQQTKIPQTKKEQEKQIKKISFVFNSEEDETNIMNKIASSINKFVNISDKNAKDFEEIKDLSLIKLLNLAKQEEKNFDYKKVIMIYQKALTMNNDDDFYTFLPTIYTKLGENFNKLSDWFNSLKYYELAVEFYESMGDVEKINECKYEIANIYYITFKNNLAKNFLEEIISQPVSTNLKVKSELLLATITGSNVKLIMPKAIVGIDTDILAELYFKYALCFDEEGDIETAVKYYKKCVETSQDPKINAYLSSSLTNLASIFDENGKTDLAIKYLQESLRLDELTKNYNGMYISSMKLAEIQSSKNPNKHLEYLIKANKYAIELNEPFYITNSEVALGDFYYNNKNYELALKNYNKAYKISSENLSKENAEKIKIRIDEIKKVHNG